MASTHDDGHAVNHDYHILPPSPWPLIGSAAAMLWALGMIVVMKGMFGIPKGAWWVAAAGRGGILYTMFGWWQQVIRESRAGDHTPVVSIGLRYGMILFIASEVMFFVAWFWMFFEMALFHHDRTFSAIEEVRNAWGAWPPKGVEVLDPWHFPLINTLTLLTSGTTVTWAHHAVQVGDRKGAKLGAVADGAPGRDVHLRSRPTSIARSSRRSCSSTPRRPTAASTARPSSWPRASTASTC